MLGSSRAVLLPHRLDFGVGRGLRHTGYLLFHRVHRLDRDGVFAPFCAFSIRAVAQREIPLPIGRPDAGAPLSGVKLTM